MYGNNRDIMFDKLSKIDDEHVSMILKDNQNIYRILIREAHRRNTL